MCRREKLRPRAVARSEAVWFGAAALVVGTSIGSGILAVPQRTAPAGFVPSAACMVTCWVFLVIEALLLAEISVHLRRKKGKDVGDGGQLEVISLKSMAQETLGEWRGNLAAAVYLFLSYSSMVAYTSQVRRGDLPRDHWRARARLRRRLHRRPRGPHRCRWHWRHRQGEPAAHFHHDRLLW